MELGYLRPGALQHWVSVRVAGKFDGNHQIRAIHQTEGGRGGTNQGQGRKEERI